MAYMSAFLSERWVRVFATELAGAPAMTLRGGDALDEYRQAPVYDAAMDRVTDAYLERYCAGLSYLDAHPGVTTCLRMLSTHFGIGRGTALGSMRFSIRCGRRIEIRRGWRR